MTPEARKQTAMASTTPTAELLFTEHDATAMSTDEATIKPWRRARECLEAAPTVWLTTSRPDGRPHVAPLLLAWVDDMPCFATRPTSRKARNLARDGRCVLAVAGHHMDLVVEGTANQITDPATLHLAAGRFREKYQWQLTVHDGHVHDNALPGPPEYCLYTIRPTLAFGYGTDGLTATRWHFP